MMRKRRKQKEDQEIILEIYRQFDHFRSKITIEQSGLVKVYDPGRYFSRLQILELVFYLRDGWYFEDIEIVREATEHRYQYFSRDIWILNLNTESLYRYEPN